VLLSGTTDLKGRKFLRNAANAPVFFSVADDDEFPPTVLAIEWLYTSAQILERGWFITLQGATERICFQCTQSCLG
jgi:hypothetical protein